MTRKEAIDVFENHISAITMGDGKGITRVKIFDDAIKTAIEALKQEPLEVKAAELQKAYNKGFEDCRQAVINTINDQKDVFYSEGDRGLFESYVNELPPVTPQPKTGRWIRGKYTEDDIRYNDSSYKCTECGRVVDTKENYCPNCGAKMESEE